MISRRNALKLGAAGLVAPSLTGALPTLTLVAQEQGGSVPMFRGNAARTGEMPGPGPSLDKPIVVKWNTGGSDEQLSPIAFGNVMYVPTGELNVTDFTMPMAHAIDLETGEELWISSIESVPCSSPAFFDGVVYMGCEKFDFCALDASTGELIWRITTGGRNASSPAVVDGLVYFGSEDGNIYALDASTGEERWRFTANDSITTSSPSVLKGIVYIGSADGNLYALDAATGTERWRFTTTKQIISSPAVVDAIVYVSCTDRYIYAIEAATGTELWRASTGGTSNSSPAIVAGTVYIGSSDNSLYALSADTGSELWRFATGGSINSSPSVCQDVVYIGSDDGNIYAIEAGSGTELWQYTTGLTQAFPVRSSAVVINGNVYIGTNLDYVSFLEVLGNPLDTILLRDVVVRGGPSSNGVERGKAKAGDVVDTVGLREEREGQMWTEVTIKDVTGWIPLDAIDPATLPPEGEIEYVYIPE